ncbi:MAG: tetratricopeptide repeat protein [Nitrospinota bacterium]
MKKRVYIIISLILIFFVTGIGQGAEEIRGGDTALKKAVSLLNEERYPDAVSELKGIAKDFPGTIWGKRATYLLGHINLKLERFEEATGYFELVIGDYDQLADYIELNLAKGYQGLGDHKKAIKASERLINMMPSSRLIPDAELARSWALYLSGDDDRSVSHLRNLIKGYPKYENLPEALSLLGHVLLVKSEPLKAYKVYQRLYTLYPADPFGIIAEEKIRIISSDKSLRPYLPSLSPEQALKRIGLLISENEYSRAIKECRQFIEERPKSPLIGKIFLRLGRCYLFRKRHKLAIETFKTFINKYPKDPRVKEALYQIANIYWNNGSISRSVQYCQKVIDRFPGSSWAEKAFYIRARINDEKRRTNEAVRLYSRIIKNFPKGKHAEEAGWKIGWMYYLNKDYQKAINAFQKTIELYPASNYRDISLYWMGRSAEKVGNKKAALSAYKTLEREYPYTYYGHKGKERLNLSDNITKDSMGTNTVNLEKEISTRISYNNPSPFDNLNKSGIENFHLKRAKELIELGLSEDAGEEIRIAGRFLSRRPEDLLRLGILYSMAEAYDDSLSILYRILYDFPGKRINNLPPIFWRLFYPLPYRGYISRYVSKNDLDLFLVEALIRQESAFDINSLSFADAHGLMQLIPKTGKLVFNSIYQDREFKKEILFDPELNILLGTRHLAELLKRYKGNLIFTLASYNAGVKKVDIWRERYKGADPDEFIEMIPYRETKGYVKKVLRNYQNYREIYSDDIQHGN